MSAPQGPGNGPHLWHCPRFDSFHLASWEEEHFLFDPGSGDTHLLNQLSIEILHQLRAAPLSAAALAGAIGDLLPADAPPLDPELLEQHLRQLDLMGLVEPMGHARS